MFSLLTFLFFWFFMLLYFFVIYNKCEKAKKEFTIKSINDFKLTLNLNCAQNLEIILNEKNISDINCLFVPFPKRPIYMVI